MLKETRATPGSLVLTHTFDRTFTTLGMKTLIDELWSYVQKGSGSLFDGYHHVYHHDLNDDLRRFLFATMDEARLWHANSYAKAILKLIDIDDADHFRQGLLRREVAGNIAYSKQRDHSAHTLHNYIMGWYIYSNSGAIRKTVSRHFKIRGLKKDRNDIDFRSLWPFVSLLHDIGYLFEGKIDPLATEIQSNQIGIGAEVVHDYFHHRFWTECGIDSIYDRNRLRLLAKVEEPDFSNRSISGVADGLRSLGDLEKLRGAVRHERDITNAPIGTRDYLSITNGLPGDAFDLWERHYDYFGLDSMVQRIRSMRTVFDSLIRDGFGNTGLRVLDHGICSGLLSLLYSTFYFRMYFGLGLQPPEDDHDRSIWIRFREASNIHYPPRSDSEEYTAIWWWTGVVWATAATALHNVQQFGDKWPATCNHPGPLRLDEDPLAYLGILVDCLQEWDRYTVTRESVIGGSLPLQGIDVRLSSKAGKVRIEYGDRMRLESVRRSLDLSLFEWSKIVEIV